ncbi:hypothetical protein TWF506_008238 [Arthrobotrys conoides]|uniref:Uncharacterized protein n=1 Tax=Arthrobotrys conoides TaxID=74498 RepID=A0AAN8NMZ7_9PEZI
MIRVFPKLCWDVSQLAEALDFAVQTQNYGLVVILGEVALIMDSAKSLDVATSILKLTWQWQKWDTDDWDFITNTNIGRKLKAAKGVLTVYRLFLEPVKSIRSGVDVGRYPDRRGSSQNDMTNSYKSQIEAASGEDNTRHTKKESQQLNSQQELQDLRIGAEEVDGFVNNPSKGGNDDEASPNIKMNQQKG